MRKDVRKPVLAAVAGLACFGGAPAFAQEGQPGAGAESDEIIVTAQRREERLIDVPVSVTALSGERMEQLQIAEVQSLASYAPALNVNQGFTGGSSLSIAIRGISSVSTQANVDQAVGIYVDDVYVARTAAANVALVDMQRLEVLRGPQGTLFGRNTIAGALNITTHRPTGRFEGYIQGSLGNYGTRGLTAVVNVPVASDKLAARFVYSHGEHDGYGRNIALNIPLSDQNFEYARGSIKANPVDGLELTLIADYFESRDHGPINVPTLYIPGVGTQPAPAAYANYVNAGGRTNQGRIAPLNTGKAYSFTGLLTYDAGPVSIKSITGYRNIDFSMPNDLDGSPLILSDVVEFGMSGHQFSQELQLSGEAIDNRLQWMAGLYYFDEKVTNNTVAAAITPTSFVTNTMYPHNTSKSAFGQVTFEILPELRLTGGIRYVKDTRRVTYYEPRSGLISTFPTQGSCLLVTQGLTTNGTACLASPPNAEFSYMPWTIGLDYKPSADVLLYGKVSKGFHSGGFQQPGQATAVGQFTQFGPENVVSYELGAKAAFLGGKLRFSGAVYHSEYNDIQMNVPYVPPGQTTPVLAVVNAGKARIDGFEFEVQGDAGPLRLGGSVGYVNARFTGGPAVGTPFNAGQTPPPLTYSAYADLTLPVSFGRFIVHGDYSWVDDVINYTTIRAFGPPRLLFTQPQIKGMTAPAHGVANAKVDLKIDNPAVTISAWVKNLTNSYYIVRHQAGYSNGWFASIPGDPRTYGVTLRVDF